MLEFEDGEVLANKNNNRTDQINSSQKQTLSNQNVNTSTTDSASEGKKSKKAGRLSRITSIFKKDSKKKDEREEDAGEEFIEAYAVGSGPVN